MDREHRVRQRDDFARLRREGRRVAHPLLRLQWAPTSLAVTRFGFIVSKRVAVRAHERNLLRRRLRELARLELSRLSSGFDIIISAQPVARTASYQELAVALTQLLQRARLQRSGAGDNRGGS